jgi:hypothetical protein
MNNIGNISGPSPQRQAPPRAQMMQPQFQNAQQQSRPGMVPSQYQPQVQNSFQQLQQQQQQPDPKHDHLVSELMHEVESKRSELENMTMSVVQWKQNFKDKLQQEKVRRPSFAKNKIKISALPTASVWGVRTSAWHNHSGLQHMNCSAF